MTLESLWGELCHLSAICYGLNLVTDVVGNYGSSFGLDWGWIKETHPSQKLMDAFILPGRATLSFIWLNRQSI